MAQGWSQEELANALKCSQQTISRWENGHFDINPRRVPELLKHLPALDDEVFYASVLAEYQARPYQDRRRPRTGREATEQRVDQLEEKIDRMNVMLEQVLAAQVKKSSEGTEGLNGDDLKNLTKGWYSATGENQDS
jgi:transcriptional regulator with XRE-family HTH domain